MKSLDKPERAFYDNRTFVRITRSYQEDTMSSEITRGVALMTLLTTMVLLLGLVLTLGLGGDSSAALTQIAPLALIAAIAVVVVVADPFSR